MTTPHAPSVHVASTPIVNVVSAMSTSPRSCVRDGSAPPNPQGLRTSAARRRRERDNRRVRGSRAVPVLMQQLLRCTCAAFESSLLYVCP
jgi:hypothetical protein